MDLCDISAVSELLTRHGFHFSKSMGQNFLVQRWVPERIADEAGLSGGVGVIEIGPGVGTLTRELSAAAERVVCVELDKALLPVLDETLADCGNVEVVSGDVLKTDLKALAEEKLPGLVPVACANLPYYITSPAIAALLEAKCFRRVTVMVQKEVAQRICAKPGTGDYGAFSVFCQYHSSPRMLFDVPAGCFIPKPKVTSTVIALDPRQEPPAEIISEEIFFRTVRASFAQRRKTLQNGLASGFSELSKAELGQIIESSGLDSRVRGETLSIAQFALIANEISRKLQ